MAKTILLVEDDEDIATLLRLNLQDEAIRSSMKPTAARPSPGWRRRSGMR